MALNIEYDQWADGKRREVRDARPLSIQTTIGGLSQRLWKAEQTLEQVRRFADSTVLISSNPDVQRGYDEARNDVARILDGGDA